MKLISTRLPSFLACFLVAVLVFGISGCGNGGNEVEIPEKPAPHPGTSPQKRTSG